jgi:hypothetical protein
MRILFFGDIFGRPGREAIKTFLPKFRSEYHIDICIANCENITTGKGVSEAKIREMQAVGVHIFSSGNHLWDKKEELNFIAKSTCIAKPQNYPKAAFGSDFVTYTGYGVPLMLVTLCGQSFMNPVNSPFHAFEEFLQNHPDLPKHIIVDFHAESTAEKRTFGHYFDGKISAMLGTHTHIQTADEEVLPGGSAYITDVGMCGSHDSVIGIQKEIIIERVKTGMPVRHVPATSGLQVNAVYIDLDDTTGKAMFIQRIREKL